MTSGERRKVCGQLVSAGHRRVFYEHRHDANATRERRRGFDAHEILGIVQAPLARGVRSEPFIADDDDQNFARRDRAFDRIDEIDARLDAFDIHEHAVSAEVPGQVI